jgi:hypothetical protein
VSTYFNILYCHHLKFDPLNILDLSLCTKKDDGKILTIEVVLGEAIMVGKTNSQVKI